jgi:hypothetical protein
VSQEQTDALLNELRAFRDDCQCDHRVDMVVGANHCIAIVENWIASRLERPAVDTTGHPWAAQEIERLRTALRPFAALCPGGFDGVGLGTRVAPSITVGMIQNAREVLGQPRDS